MDLPSDQTQDDLITHIGTQFAPEAQGYDDPPPGGYFGVHFGYWYFSSSCHFIQCTKIFAVGCGYEVD